MDELDLAGAPVYDANGAEIGRVVDATNEGGARAETGGLWIALNDEPRPFHVQQDLIRAATHERVTLALTRESLLGDDHTITVPLHEEVLSAATREVERGRVRVHKRVETAPHEETLTLGHEEVSVERVQVGEIVDQAPAPRWEGDTLIVPLVEEVLFVEKRLRVSEELRVTRARVEAQQTIREDLRREVAEVETTGDIDVTGPA